MAKACFIRDNPLERLRTNIVSNASRYKSDTPWLADYFGAEAYYLESKIEMPDSVVLNAPAAGAKSELNDLENTKIIYAAFKHLSPLQASDERLWTYLSHVTFWHYMRRRWAVEQYESKTETLSDNIRTRYLFMSDHPRALVRNGISRLWWYGFTSYDEKRSDPFELTGVLLKNLDVAQSILERALSRNRTVAHAILAALLEREQSGEPYYNREGVRDLVKYVRYVGGVTIIDALSFEQVNQLVVSKLNALATGVTA